MKACLRNGSDKNAANVWGTDTGKFNGRSVSIKDLLKITALVIGNTICVHFLIFLCFIIFHVFMFGNICFTYLCSSTVPVTGLLDVVLIRYYYYYY